jgi:hypothetical protein
MKHLTPHLDIITVTKHDVNGVPYEARVVATKERTRSELWEWFKNRAVVEPVRGYDGKGYLEYEENLKTKQDGY